MKVVNHKKGNYTFDDTQDGSVMYGTIYVTDNEWRSIVEYLRKAKAHFKDTYHRDGLAHLFSWTLPQHGNKKRLCLGVSNTELVFKRFGIPRYKRQNYVFERV